MRVPLRKAKPREAPARVTIPDFRPRRGCWRSFDTFGSSVYAAPFLSEAGPSPTCQRRPFEAPLAVVLLGRLVRAVGRGVRGRRMRCLRRMRVDLPRRQVGRSPIGEVGLADLGPDLCEVTEGEVADRRLVPVHGGSVTMDSGLRVERDRGRTGELLGRARR